jgi:hypothetical protein
MTDDAAGKRLFLVRLALGLGQGLLLYFLYHAQEAKTWPATSGMLFGPLLLIFLFIPLLLNQALGEMVWRRAALWALIAAAVIAVLGVYDLWGAWPVTASGTPQILPSARLFFFCAPGSSSPMPWWWGRRSTTASRRPIPLISTLPGSWRCNWRWQSCSWAFSGCCCGWVPICFR